MKNAVIEQNAKVVNELGFHARAAAVFVKHAGSFKSDIMVCKNGIEVNAKSIMGILMLAMPRGEVFSIRASGEDAAEAVDTLCTLVKNKFGEPQ